MITVRSTRDLADFTWPSEENAENAVGRTLLEWVPEVLGDSTGGKKKKKTARRTLLNSVQTVRSIGTVVGRVVVDPFVYSRRRKRYRVVVRVI